MYFIFLDCNYLLLYDNLYKFMILYWFRYWFIFYIGKLLLMVALFGLAVFFCYSLIFFVFFREIFLKEDDGRYCRTVYYCFIIMIYYGFVDSFYTVRYFWWNLYFVELYCIFVDYLKKFFKIFVRRGLILNNCICICIENKKF